MKNGFRVIDADAHMQEPFDLWKDYVEPEFYDRRPVVTDVVGKLFFHYAPGELFPEEASDKSGTGLRPGNALFVSERVWRHQEVKYGDAFREFWTPESRIRDMDRYGWDKQVLIPGTGSLINGPRLADKDPALILALTRAYNNWAADFASTDASKLKPVVTLPSVGPEQIVAETLRCMTRGEFVTLNLPSANEGQTWEDSSYDAVWNTCVDLDMPVSLHGVNAVGPDVRTRYSSKPGIYVALTHVIGNSLEDMMSLAHFIFTGILERFPTLRISALEGNVAWVPWLVSRMDDHIEGRQVIFTDDNTLPKLPSEYFFRQCFVAGDADEKALKYAADYTDGERIVWNTDYPHPDAPDPDKALDQMLDQPISDEHKRKILWDNPVKLYGERILS